MDWLVGLIAIISLCCANAAFRRARDLGAKFDGLEREIAGLRAALRSGTPPPQQAPERAAAAAAGELVAALVPEPAFHRHAPPPPLEPLAPQPVEAVADDAAAEKPAAGPKATDAAESLRTRTTRIEARLSGNWLIWVGGAALAFGGAFLLKAAVDAGFFGPGLRIAAALLAGFAMIAGGEWARRTQTREIAATKAGAAWRGSIAPPVLAGAGGATLYATVFAAYSIYDMMPGAAALFLLAAASATLVWLAMRHRAPALAQMGLAGAFVAPLLTGGDSDGAMALLAYVFAASAAGFFLMRKMNWRSAGLISLAGGLSWPALLIAARVSPFDVALYLPAFAALAAAAAWRDAKDIPDLKNLFGGAAPGAASLGVFHLALCGVTALAQFGGAGPAEPVATLWFWSAIAVLTLALAGKRDGFSLAPLIALAGVILAAIVDHVHDIDILDSGAGLALAVVFGVGGALAMQFRDRKAPLAIVAGIGPIALLALHVGLGRSDIDAVTIAGGALALAGANVGLLVHLRRRAGSFDAHPGAASALVVGASFATSVVAVALFDGLFLSVALAAQAPVLALLWRQYRLSALKYVSAAIAIAASARLFLLPEIVDYSFGSAPVFNLLIAGYAAPAAAFWFAARVFEQGGLSRNARVIQALEGAAIALFAAFVSLEIRHMFHAGDIGAISLTFLELSLQIVSWMSITAFMRWRFGGALTIVRRLSEIALTGVSLGAAFFGSFIHFHPVWGFDPELIKGPPVFNRLILFYLAPALAFAAASVAARRGGAKFQSRLTAAAAALMGLAWLSLTIRQAFNGPDLSHPYIDLSEVSLTIVAWILIAAALRWRHGAGPAPVVRAAENLLLAGAACLYGGVSLFTLNPWWGVAARPVAGPLLLNMTIIHFAAPALALAAAAYAARSSAAMLRSRALGLASAFAGLVYLVMTVRHAFHAPDLSDAPVGVAEAWSYSAAMTLYAAALLVAGALKRSDIVRRAGFAVLLLAILKVFIADLSGLDGLWRATAFLGLGAAIVGIAILYQRLNRSPA